MRRTRLAMALLLSFGLAACDTTSDVIDALDPSSLFEDDAPAADNTEPQPVPNADAPYPQLGAVPDRPAEPGIAREYMALAEVLAADRENALYTDETIRRQSPPVRVNATGLPVTPPEEPPVASAITPPPTPQQTPAPTPAPAPEPIVAPQPAATPAPQPVPAPQPAQTAAVPQPAPAPEPLSPAASASPVSPPPPSAADLAAVPAVGEQSPALQSQLIATIYFPSGGAGLTERDRDILRQVAEIYGRDGGKRVVVVGHSSARGASGDQSQQALVNYKVSLDRAASVGQSLVTFGVALDEIVVDARGATELKYSEETPAGEAGNRRAEIFLQY